MQSRRAPGGGRSDGRVPTRGISGQARSGPDAGALRRRGAGRGGPALHDPQARGAPAPLRSPARDGGGARFVGGAEGAAGAPAGQAAGGARGGPSPRVRRLRGRDPGGELRGGALDRLGPRPLSAGRRRRAAGGRPAGQARSGLLRLQNTRPVRARAHRARRARLAPHQEGGRGGLGGRADRALPGVRALRAHRGRAGRGRFEARPRPRLARGGPRPPRDGDARPTGVRARHAGRASARGPGLDL